jgi:hypothetical protein
MQAIVYHDNKDIRLEEVPEPVPGPGEVKLRINALGSWAVFTQRIIAFRLTPTDSATSSCVAFFSMRS